VSSSKNRRALRTHWDPSGVFLANHEIKDS
jgi:hypothetical protein